MAKLIHILAASVGGGLVLGASIRLGEAIGASGPRGESQRGRRREPASRHDLCDRLDRLERRVQTNSGEEILAGVVARLDRQQADVEAMRDQMAGTGTAPDSPGEIAFRLRADIRRQISDDLDRRLADVEEKLHSSMEAANRETVNAMLASIEKRLAPRIDRLESEIIGQSAVIAALRDCSLQSERGIQRLLTVLERTVNPGQGQTGAGDSGRAEWPKLAVVTSRGQDDPGGGGSEVRRPASFR